MIYTVRVNVPAGWKFTGLVPSDPDASRMNNRIMFGGFGGEATTVYEGVHTITLTSSMSVSLVPRSSGLFSARPESATLMATFVSLDNSQVVKFPAAVTAAVPLSDYDDQYDLGYSYVDLSIPPTQCQLSGCKSCKMGVAGSAGASLGSVDLSIALGVSTITGYPAPRLILHAGRPTDLTYSRDDFSFEGLVSEGTDSSMPGTNQFLSETTVVQVVDPSSTDQQVELRFFSRDTSRTLEQGNYPLQLSDVPHTSMTIAHPASGSDVLITRTVGSHVQTWAYSFSEDVSANSTTWVLQSDDDASPATQTLTTVRDEANGTRTETRSEQNASGALLSKTVEIFKRYSFGERLVQRTVDPDGRQLISRWSYYDNNVQYGYSQLRAQVSPAGNWSYFEYDVDSRLCKEVQQTGNAVLTDLDSGVPSDNVNRVRSSTRTTTGGRDITTTTISELGVITSKSYRVIYSDGYDDIVCLRPDAAWDDTDSLVTKQRHWFDAQWAFRSRLLELPDGTAVLHALPVKDGSTGAVTTVESAGVPQRNSNGEVTAINKGRRTTTTTNPQGYVTSTKVEDIETSAVLAWTTATVDGLGRPSAALNELNGRSETTVYDCCSVSSTTDARGVTTGFTRSATENTETRQGITTKIATNGLTTVVTRQGTDSSWMELSRTTTNVAGETVSSSTRGYQTTETRSTDANGRQVHTTTSPDGGTRIETTNQDGTLYSLTGTAVQPVRYEEGVDAATNTRWNKQIALNSNGSDTQEWTKTWTDFAGRVWKTESSASAAANYRYFNGNGQLSKSVDPDGVTTLYVYNDLGELTTTCLDINRNDAIDFNGMDRITSTTRTYTTHGTVPVERVTTAVYAADNNATPTTVGIADRSLDGTQSWSTSNGLTTQLYEQITGASWAGNWTATTLYPDNSTRIDTFTNSRLTMQQRKDSTGAVIGESTLTYDSHGRISTQTDGLGATAATTYETRTNPVSGGAPTTADLPLTVQSPPQQTGGTGPVTTFDYDSMGRQIKVTDALNGTTETEYFPTGQVKRVFGTRSYPVSYTYTAQGRIDTMTTQYGSSNASAVTSWVYESTSGRLQQKKHGTQTCYTLTYTSAGRLLTKTNARNIATTYSRNNAGDATGIDYSDSTPEVSYCYTRMGQMKSAVANGVTHSAEPDAFGIVTAESWQGGPLHGAFITNSQDTLHRDSGHTVFSFVDFSVDTGRLITYDEASRVKSVIKPSHFTEYPLIATHRYEAGSSVLDKIEFKTDMNGGGEATATHTLTADYTHDLQGNLTGISYAAPNTAATISHGYDVDAIQRRTAVTREDASKWEWSYNDRNEVIAAARKFTDGTINPLEQFSYSFDAIGNRTASNYRAAANRETSYAPNALNQYTARITPSFLPIEGGAATNANVIVNSTFATRKGTRFMADVPVSNATQSLQQKMQVIAAIPGGGSGGTDLVSQQSGTRFVPQANETLLYDDDGNLTQDAHWLYTWDAENRCTSMTERADNLLASADNPPRMKLEFTYAVTGQRLTKKVSTFSTTTNTWSESYHTEFGWRGWQLETEDEFAAGASTPRLRRFYTWDVASDGGAGKLLFIKIIIAPDAASAVLVPAYDGNGNVMALFTQTTSATKVATHEYDPFGNELAGVFLASNAECRLNPFRFSTQYQDVETGLLNYGMRLYSPELGRFLSRDPLGELAGPNPYALVRNDPLNAVDRLGLLDVAGHFWTVYGLAIASGEFSATSAFDLAYYAQLPDLVRWLDATQLAYYKLPVARRRLVQPETATAEIDRALLGQNSWTWTQDVQDWIHSLSGAKNQQQVLQRQCCLSDMLRSGAVGGQPMTTWERGFVIHALGDAYAHTVSDPTGLYTNGAFGGADTSPLGHGLQGSQPDLIGERLIPYHRYVVNLFDLIGGSDRDLRDGVETLGIGTAGLNNEQANEQMARLIKSNPAFNWNNNGYSSFDPNKPFSTLPDHYIPSAAEVRNLMDRMKKHCTTFK